MPEFLSLLPPDEARELLLEHLSISAMDADSIEVMDALGRIAGEDIFAPHPLPEFPRSTVDGFAVRAMDTHGASDSLPAYLTLIGEVPMGDVATGEVRGGQCVAIHTGGMVPKGADAVVMLEFTQSVRSDEIEIFKSIADGENIIRIGEDVAQGQLVIPKGTSIRPAEIGGLMALGITSIRVARKPRVGLISTGDEVIDPGMVPRMGQVRDVNSYTLGSLIEISGGVVVRYGIVRDQFEVLKNAARKALRECDAVIITAGSSASTRDLTADVIRGLGAPGVLVHGINTRPGKPTILGVCNGKAVVGLPGNPVSALVNGHLFVMPLVEKLLGKNPRARAVLQARLTVNLASQAGREDWWPVKLFPVPSGFGTHEHVSAEPIFGKSNLIFTLAAADGLLRIPPDATGLSAGDMADVILI